MPTVFTSHSKHILLADDDEDDCFLFKNALEELSIPFILTTVYNGEELMEWLRTPERQLPEILFLDLNMPRKNGFECLLEIRSDNKFDQLPVIVFSSAYAPEVIELLYKGGAHYYVRKPDGLEQYRKVIYHSLHLRH